MSSPEAILNEINRSNSFVTVGYAADMERPKPTVEQALAESNISKSDYSVEICPICNDGDKDHSVDSAGNCLECGYGVDNPSNHNFSPIGHPDMPELTNDAGESTNVSIADTLTERGSRYGAFSDHARISQTLLSVIKSNSDYDDMEPYMQEALTMICHKLARIANGDPYYDDSWRDIAGYSQLVVDILNGKNT